MKFCNLNIVSGAVDAGKWSAEHFRHSLLFEFNRGAKAMEAARNICTVYGDNATGESRQETGLLVLRKIVLTLVILHV